MTSARPDDLPDFGRPPVVETVLSAQFQPLSQMKAAHFGLFWNQIRNRYPKTEERPTMDPVVEKFPEPIRRTLRVQFPVSETPPLPRFGLSTKTKTSCYRFNLTGLLGTGAERAKAIPTLATKRLRGLFEHDFEEFREVAQEKLGAIEVNQCEVTYVDRGRRRLVMPRGLGQGVDNVEAA